MMNPSKSGVPVMKVTNIGASTTTVALRNPETCPHDNVTNRGDQHGCFRICQEYCERWTERVPLDRKMQVWEEHERRAGKEPFVPGSRAASGPQAGHSSGVVVECQACGTRLQEIPGKTGLRLTCQNYPHCAWSQKSHSSAKKSTEYQEFADSENEHMEKEPFEGDTHAAM